MFSKLPLKSFRTLFLQRAFSSKEISLNNSQNQETSPAIKNKKKEQEKM